MARDYYEVLGINRNASTDDIKKAFRGLARQYHPDVSKEENAEAKFKEINEAYEVLSDEQKRARYDRFGHAGVSGGAGQSSGFGGYASYDEIFNDVFSTFFGGRQGASQRGPRKGEDLRLEVQLSFDEAYFGLDKEMTFPRLEVCDTCEGSGAKAGTKPITCPECKGTGESRRVENTPFGRMVRTGACPRCGGKTTIVESPCTTCDGSGKRRKQVKMTHPIPAGIFDGARLQIRAEGHVGDLGARRGDLELVIRVAEHKFFKRREYDIILDLPINVAQAALGAKIQVPTMTGEEEIKIDTGTQTGKMYRLKGKGFPRLRNDGTSSGRGDMLVYITVEVPSKLTERQRQLFEELAQTLDGSVNPQNNGRGFFDKVMDFFGGEQN
jgi:molecular chaperone DnaJ